MRLDIKVSMLLFFLLMVACTGQPSGSDIDATVNAAISGTRQAEINIQGTVDTRVSGTLEAQVPAEAEEQITETLETIEESTVIPTSPMPSATPLAIDSTNAEGYPLTLDSSGTLMVQIPAGAFNMGSETSDSENERPRHPVQISEDFWIDVYEVTNEQFIQFLNGGEGPAERWYDWSGQGARIRRVGGTWSIVEGCEDHPVTEVTWYGAQAYCEWRDGRLPTEAEWEYAARGTGIWLYPWGSEAATSTVANFNGYIHDTTPVGNYPDGRSPFGLYDVAGNVWEWVADWYGPYDVGLLINPVGPESGSHRVVRGGSWASTADMLRGTFRGSNPPDQTWGELGFRCVGSP